MVNLGGRLKRARTMSGLSQVELGERVGVTGSTINRYEQDRRKPDPDTLVAMADVLGVSIDWLLGRVDLHGATVAAGRVDDPLTPLPPDAAKSIEDFIEFVERKYAKTRREEGEQ